MMTITDTREVVGQCSFQDYRFEVKVDGRGSWYLQGFYEEPDVETGRPSTQVTRRWFLSPAMTRSEVVQTVFKCALTSMEHRTREFFHYRGKAVFGPHFNVETLWDVCEAGRLDRREG